MSGMEQVTEIDGDRIRILALSRGGYWLPLFELEITPEVMDIYRVPLLLKAESLGHLDQSYVKLLPEGEGLATPQS